MYVQVVVLQVIVHSLKIYFYVQYHFVAQGVAPKRARLKEAEDELAVVMAQLAVAKATLKEVNDRIAFIFKKGKFDKFIHFILVYFLVKLQLIVDST